MAIERHGKVAVEPAALLRRCQRAVVRDRSSVRKRVEVEARDRDARLVRPVVEHLDEEGPHCLRWTRGERHPDVTNGARPVDVSQSYPLTRSEAAAGCSLPAAMR